MFQRYEFSSFYTLIGRMKFLKFTDQLQKSLSFHSFVFLSLHALYLRYTATAISVRYKDSILSMWPEGALSSRHQTIVRMKSSLQGHFPWIWLIDSTGIYDKCQTMNKSFYSLPARMQCPFNSFAETVKDGFHTLSSCPFHWDPWTFLFELRCFWSHKISFQLNSCNIKCLYW